MDAATRDDDARRAGATTTAIDGDDDDDGTRATTTTTTTTTTTATAVKTPTGRDDGDDGFCPAWTRRGRGTIASAAWRRPALAACSLEDFTFDLMRFHQERGRDWEQCWANLDRVVGRTGAPLDCLHLYRQVCSLGGFASRTSAKERIKAAEIFRNMFNHYENHTMTDCGNRMLTAYENYFLEYEAAHEEDLTRGTCGNCGGGIQTSIGTVADLLHECVGCERMFHGRCQPPEVFPPIHGEGKNAGCSTRIVCFECRAGGAYAASTKLLRDEREDADSYQTRLYECVARRGRRYKSSYVRPTRAIDEGTRAIDEGTRAIDEDAKPPSPTGNDPDDGSKMDD